MNLTKKQSYPLLAAIGVITYMVADVMHEAVGHGSACLLQGGKITLITSVYFRAAVHSFITDFGGPLMNLLTGLLICVVLQRTKIINAFIQLLLLITAAFNLFWFSWLCIYSSITYKGDFSFVFNTSGGLLIRKIALLFFGLGAYWVFIKLISKIAGKFMYKLNGLAHPFLIPYLSACFAALIAVSCYSPISANTYMEAIHFPMFLPLLFLPRFINTQNNNPHEPASMPAASVPWSRRFVVIAALLFVVFCLLMGRGIRP